MFHIMKAQNYQIRHDMFSVIAILIIAGISIYMAVSDSVTGSERFVAMGENLPMLWLVICLVIGVRIAAWDFNDKTINYELLSGHSRGQLYGGRLVCAVLWCMCLCLITTALPLAVCSAQNGWGVQADFVHCVFRILVGILPLLRILAEFFLLAVILRNCYVTYAVGYILTGVSMLVTLLLSEHFQIHNTYALGYVTLTEALGLTNSHMELIGGVDVTVYDSVMAADKLAGIVVSSVAVSVVCLAMGYAIFKKRDME